MYVLIYMHETLEYYRYINLCNFESDTLVLFYFILSTIYLKVYIIFLKYIYMFKIITNLNANKKINENFNIFRIKYLIVEFRKIDAIEYTQMITKLTVNKID